MKRRIIEIDVLRGLAMVGVVAIHISSSAFAVNRTSLWGTLWAGLDVGMRWAVPVFVIVSGWGLCLSQRQSDGYLRFVWHRVSKVLPAYVVWSLIYMVLSTLGSHAAEADPLTPSYVAHTLVMGSAASHLYFVPLIVQLYLLFPLVGRYIGTGVGLVMTGGIAVALVVVSSHWATLAGLIDAPKPLSVLCWAFYFAVGIWLARPGIVERLRASRNKVLLSAALALAFVAIAVWTRPLGPEVGCEKIRFLTVPYTLLITGWVCTRGYWEKSRVTRWLQLVSKHSFAIYLSHAVLLIAAHRAMRTLGLSGYGLAYLLVYCVVMVVGLVLLIGAYQSAMRSVRSLWRPKKTVV